MDFGKKDGRLWIPQQVRIASALSARIQATSAEDGLPMPVHITQLLMYGLNYRDLLHRYGKQGLLRHVASSAVMPDFRREDHANTERTQDVTPRHAKPPVRVGQPQRKRGVA